MNQLSNRYLIFLYTRSRLADEQRMQIKAMEDAARDKYSQDIRDMTTAAASTNMQQFGEKQSREKARYQYEINRDQTDLNHVNASTLRPS